MGGSILKIAVVFYNNAIGLEFVFVNQTSRTFDRLGIFFEKNCSIFQFLICFFQELGRQGSFLKFVYYCSGK